jgi:hypothetical protein
MANPLEIDESETLAAQARPHMISIVNLFPGRWVEIDVVEFVFSHVFPAGFQAIIDDRQGHRVQVERDGRPLRHDLATWYVANHVLRPSRSGLRFIDRQATGIRRSWNDPDSTFWTSDPVLSEDGPQVTWERFCAPRGSGESWDDWAMRCMSFVPQWQAGQ